MKIQIYGWGGEVVVGSITREQYVYWKLQDDDDALTDHVLNFDEDELEDDSVALGAWHDNDSIEHTHGAEYSAATVIVFDENDKILFEKSVESITANHPNVVKHTQGFDRDNTEHEFVFMAYSGEKGVFNEIEVPDNNFDINKLKISVVNVDGFEIVDGLEYLHPEAKDTEEWGTNGKSFECWIISTKNDDNSDEEE